MKNLFFFLLICCCSCKGIEEFAQNAEDQFNKPQPASEQLSPWGTLTDTERNKLTTRSFQAKSDTIFDILLSLLQDEGCLLLQANRQTGLITARQHIPYRYNLFSYTRGEMREMSFHLRKITDRTTEIRLTIYRSIQYLAGVEEGYVFSKNDQGLLLEKEIYSAWFDKLEKFLSPSY